MKKKLTAIVLGIIMTLGLLTGCNKQIIDTTYRYEQVQLILPNGEIIEGEVKSWTDYADGDQIQVKIDGKPYLVHSSNIVLMGE